MRHYKIKTPGCEDVELMAAMYSAMHNEEDQVFCCFFYNPPEAFVFWCSPKSFVYEDGLLIYHPMEYSTTDVYPEKFLQFVAKKKAAGLYSTLELKGK